MARRHLVITVHVDVDEDRTRDREADDPTWWTDRQTVLTDAAYHIILDNMPADAIAHVEARDAGITYEGRI